MPCRKKKRTLGKIAKSLVGKVVPKKWRRKYGGRYSLEEAREAAGAILYGKKKKRKRG